MASIPSLRAVFSLLAIGVILLVVSLFLAGRDIAFARSEAEAEVLALTETAAVAIQFVPTTQIESYLAELVEHPAIAMATVYSSTAGRTIRRRPPSELSPVASRLTPSLGAPVETCRALPSGTLCLQADSGYYRSRLGALIIPHAVLLLAAAILLLVAWRLARGSGGGRMRALAALMNTAAAESNYSVRAKEESGEVGAMAAAVNKLFAQIHDRDLTLRRRSTELESANRELEAFSYSVSHDLRSPLASIDGFSAALDEFYSENLDEGGREYLKWIRDAVTQMKDLVAGLMQISQVSRSELARERVDLSAIATSIAQTLRQKGPGRSIDFRIDPGLIVEGDSRLLHAVLENLMSNSFKFTRNRETAVIELGSSIEGERLTYFVRDNGAGFDATHGAKMFTPFQRLHSAREFEGTGIGLATVKRIIERHGGAIWAEGQVDHGATFYFTLPPFREETSRSQ